MVPGSHIQKWHKQGLHLWLDLAQILQAWRSWNAGLYQQKAVFYLWAEPTIGTRPKMIVAAGLALVIDYLAALRFPVNDIYYLGSLRKEAGKPFLDEGFLNYLQRFTFQCDIDAVAEGTVVFEGQPLLRLEGSITQIQLVSQAISALMGQASYLTTMFAGLNQETSPAPRFATAVDTSAETSIMQARADFLANKTPAKNLLAANVLGIPACTELDKKRETPDLISLQWRFSPARLQPQWGLQAIEGQETPFSHYQIWRAKDASGAPLRDILFEQKGEELLPTGTGLLQPILKNGVIQQANWPDLFALSEYCAVQQALFSRWKSADYPLQQGL